MRKNGRNSRKHLACASMPNHQSIGASNITSLQRQPQMIFYVTLQPFAPVVMHNIDGFPHKAVAPFYLARPVRS